MNFYLRCVAWFVLVGILIITVGPITLRPVTGEPVVIERFLAFFIVGALFALAYPKRWLSVLMLVVGSAALFELLQRIAPGRHGEVSDFLFKAAGGLAGVICGYAMSRFLYLADKPRK
ncbi:VanZ family protein [Phyllobacterium salinisoli]|uniref:VanZ family protein n=1 Tax=Phyllobacterium salinisoli TaxID=1899321 RepID=A0A368K557_9HYPH|nr:VanZ family protein [Phyllobacterium salinisoli]RCS24361.1 VanZ family protein [Phyllobacterium salinisoli]